MTAPDSSSHESSIGNGGAEGDATPVPPLKRLALAIGRTFFNGLIAILPIGATIVVLGWLAGMFESLFEPPIRRALELAQIPAKDVYVTGMGFVLGLLLIFLLGLAVKAYMVRQLLRGSESLLQRLPLARTVMNSVRDVTGFFTSGERKQMSQVVLVRLSGAGLAGALAMPVDPDAAAVGTAAPSSGPAPGACIIGFVTRTDLSDLPAAVAAGDRVAVYVPLSYALGGVTLLVPRASLQPLDMTMEQAMRFMLTAGMKSEAKVK